MTPPFPYSNDKETKIYIFAVGTCTLLQSAYVRKSGPVLTNLKAADGTNNQGTKVSLPFQQRSSRAGQSRAGQTRKEKVEITRAEYKWDGTEERAASRQANEGARKHGRNPAQQILNIV